MGKELEQLLKSKTFEFLLNRQKMTQEEQMHHVLHIIRKTIDTDGIWCLLEGQRSEEQRWFHSDGHESIEAVATHSKNVHQTIIKHTNNLSSLLNEQEIITFTYAENCNGYIYFPQQYKLDISTKDVISAFLTHIVSFILNDVEKDISQMNETLFWLAYKLQENQETEGVLYLVYHTLQELFPSREMKFLLVHEIVQVDLPISLFKYDELNDKKASKEAFLNNELKIERVKDKQHLYAPLSGSQAVYGLLQMTEGTNYIFDNNEKEWIEKICDLAGRALERTTLFENSNQLVTELQYINEAAQQLNENLNSTEVVRIIKQHIQIACTPSEIGIIFYEDKAANAFRIAKTSTAFFHTECGALVVEHIHKELSHYIRPIIVGNFQEEFPQCPFNSLIAIPMTHADYFVGILIVTHPTRYYFSFNNFKFLQAFSQHASLSLMNAYLKDELKQATITDYLTKISTRGHIDEVMEKDLAIMNHGAFMLFDVDDFKSINDKHGHYIGDEILIQLATVLKELVQGEGVAARWGGEEFAVYLRGKSMDCALKKAEQIRSAVMQRTNPSVTVSCGIFAWEKSTPDKKPTQIFIQADEALYEAKETGKNKIVTYM